jgi:pimeloyl-ACP methyl ester carboxylesterase
VLFVHGSPNAGSKWAPLAAQLTDFRCLILDRPGCGLSDPVDYSTIDLRRFGAELLGETLDGLGLPRASVVASSLGGALAFYFAQAHPERVERLVQEGCPAFVEGFRVPIYNIFWSAMSMIFGAAPPSQAAFRKIGHAAGIDRGKFESEVLVWRDALLESTDTARHENSLNRNIARRSRKYTYGVEFLQQITPPTLYLWGEDDPFGGIKIAKMSAAAQPHAALKSFPSAGHLPWLDDPGAHAHLVRAFLQGEQV